ncbi:hypothetical protein [Natronincola ferrireducens]|uniref:Uncharacterized protein n=1 Tax=Natronincola ferrireducens TaxID=393762 RepID=A0A1G8YJC3_9FIRM|nr:hypothetical protein [Natronincola ferrireducens]SDK02979.1 hypothetical protein SAMN05660472_00563 [Natronincola ferrireducens]
MKHKEYEKDTYLNAMYPLNPKSGNLIIEILLEKYIYLFNEWDNASFKRRDLDPDLIFFLDECSQEVSLEHDIELVITVTEEERDITKENNIIKGFKNQYSHYLTSEERSLKELYKKTLLYVIAAFTILFASSILEETLTVSPLSTTVIEGSYIGGWVFAWEAVSNFFFLRGEVKRKIKEYKRILKAPILFVYLNEK